MTPEQVASRPPSPLLLALESRALLEWQALVLSYPLLRTAPRGDGHPVLVVPGLAASDSSTRPLRAYLTAQGYAAHGWRLGQNRGRRDGAEAAMQARLAEIAGRYGRKVSLIGWSLGGVFAREMAREQPDKVRQVISLGSGFGIRPTATTVGSVFEKLSGLRIDEWVSPERSEIMRRPPPVPATSIYSRTDGIVAWQGCLEIDGPQSENIEIESSHCGIGHHPAALYAIADRLAQPEGGWRHFERSGLRRLVFRQPPANKG